MGLFDALFGRKPKSNVEMLDDQIWLSIDAKFDGVRNQLQNQMGSSAVLLIAHFDDTLERLLDIVNGFQGKTSVQAILVDDLSSDFVNRLNINESDKIDLIVAERHPLPAEDKKVIQFAESLPCRCRLSYHLSMEDPVLKAFAGDHVKNILKMIGMMPNEAISSTLVSRRIKAALKKIEAKSFDNSAARSAAEWLELNMPRS